MSAQASDYTDGTYYVCETCKEGKYVASDMEINVDWLNHHKDHPIQIEIATRFLSTFLADGYIDVDRPDMEPLKLSFPADPNVEKTGLQPGGVAGALATQRLMRIRQDQDRSGLMPLESDQLEELRTLENARRPVLMPPPPSIKDMQVTLPWSVHYSRDFRSNPEAHKDFRHAITHVMKAGGKLCAIIDDFDHKRSSEEDHRVKDYLADLVICAMRAANTHPGGVIDLMQAVQDRVQAKNFTEVKKVDQDQ